MAKSKDITAIDVPAEMKKHGLKRAIYKGTREDLTADGIVKEGEFPGDPGRGVFSSRVGKRDELGLHVVHKTSKYQYTAQVYIIEANTTPAEEVKETPPPPPPRSNVAQLRLIPPAVNKDVVAAAHELLRDAFAGKLIGLAFVAQYTRQGWVSDVVGEVIRNPTFARGVLQALDDSLIHA